jgi:hypothetical protein
MVAMTPLVAVAEGHRRLSMHQPADLVRGVSAHLQGGLGQLRQRMVLDERDVADREDPVVPGDPEIGSGHDAPAARLRQAPSGDRVRRRHASRPHRDVAAEGTSVGEHDLARGDLGDGGAQPDVHATRGQLAARVVAARSGRARVAQVPAR